MQVTQQKIQYELALTLKATGEARSDQMQGTETCAARTDLEHPVDAFAMMEIIVERENMRKALKRVQLTRERRELMG